MSEADGIIFGSPVYFSMMATELKALCDRAFYVARANGDLYKRKVGAAVVAVRRPGGIPAFDAINHYFLISQMIVPGSSYWKGDWAEERRSRKRRRRHGNDGDAGQKHDVVAK